MLNQTTETALRCLIFLALRAEDTPIAPRQIANILGLSASYSEKVARLLVKTDILRAQKGSRGGVVLSRAPGDISLQEIVEACQGKILANYCVEADDLNLVCGYHKAMAQLHDAMVGILTRWTLADLAAKPCPSPEIADGVDCRMGVFPRQKNGGF